MKFVEDEDIRRWHGATRLDLGLGVRTAEREYLERSLKLPVHLQYLLAANHELGTLGSIPFYSLCKGLFLPLSYLSPERVRQYFGLREETVPDSAGREKMIETFLLKDVGLSVVEKIGCILGDPFLGGRSQVRRDSLIRLLLSVRLCSRQVLLDRLSQVGDVAVLFAENVGSLKRDPPLTSAEVLRSLKLLPDLRTTERFDLLRSLFARCGKLEAFFLARLILRKAGFGTEYQGNVLAQVLARNYLASIDQVSHAMALTDAYRVAQVLDKEGAHGLIKIQLQPLVAVRPALAGGAAEDIQKFPVWCERKYDGIRLMLHKSTDSAGNVLCGAYTRNRGDWMDLVPGLDRSIAMLPVRSAIVDGELCGTVMDFDQVRPASVYEVYAGLQGAPIRPVQMKFAAFDLIYLNGSDLTGLPLRERRQYLTQLLWPLSQMPMPIGISLVEGQLAPDRETLNRLFQHFRAQGYEGIVTKDLEGTYKLAMRDPNWMKRKPQITLDLVIVGATFAVTTKETAGAFGSYVIAAKSGEGEYEIVGDVAGVDRDRDLMIQGEITRDGLMTGRRIERESSSGVRTGVELRPSIVVTIKFEGIARDLVTRKLSLRDPKIAVIRSDKSADEADHIDMLQRIYLNEAMS